MTDTKQPEALRLAEFALKRQSRLGPCRECTGCQEDAWDGYTRTSKLLLEQHAAIEAKDARIAALETENRTLKEQHEAIGAGGVTGLRVAEIAKPLIARALVEWHEEDGPVAWWAWCGHEWAGEPAWIGTPLCDDWPGYHTHWTKHPQIPISPAIVQEGGK